jgi:putative transposase
MEKCYKFRVYPDNEQQILMQKTFGCCRYVYNYFLAERIETYKNEQKSVSRYDQDKRLTCLKQELDWLREVDRMALQAVLQNLERAYQNFFRRVKNNKKPGFPRFKRKRDNRKSYKSKVVGKNIEVHEKEIKLPNLGKVECRVSQKVSGRILSATISQNPRGKYFVSVCCTEVEIPQYRSTSKSVGFDMGLHDFAVSSEGIHFKNHKYLAKSPKRLEKFQRRLSRKTKSGSNRNKVRRKVARLHERVSNQRNDALHKLSTNLVKRYDVICVEDLQIKNMVKNRRLAKSINDAAWGEFIRQLAYKCGWQHKALVKVDKFFPSSQTCNSCGSKNREVKDLSVRNWTCSVCGSAHDRDENAAVNILVEGQRILKLTHEKQIPWDTGESTLGEFVEDHRKMATNIEPRIHRL